MRPDEPKRSALDRLTENEKAVLRRRLAPQTAKEMAADLGISPHAVEKRLKMARTKLGVSSSLAAARLLADFEQRYQPLGPQESDIPSHLNPPQADMTAQPKTGLRHLYLLGGFAMIGALILTALVAQGVSAPNRDAAAPPPTPPAQPIVMRKADATETVAFLRSAFRSKDRDHSGYLDAAEVSTLEPRDRNRDKTLPPAPPPGERDRAAEQKWMAKLDNNRDGWVSEQEYVDYMLPWMLLSGVPSNWRQMEADSLRSATGAGGNGHRE